MTRSLIQLLVLLCLFGSLAPAWAVPSAANPLEQAFQQRDYRAVLRQVLAAAPAPTTSLPPTIPTLLMLAIALQQEKGWDGDAGARVQAWAGGTPAGARTVNALRQWLDGNPAGLLTLAGDPAARAGATFLRAARLAREHGFPQAADGFTVLSPDMPSRRVQAYLRLPAAQRATVDQAIAQAVDPTNQRLLATTADHAEARSR